LRDLGLVAAERTFTLLRFRCKLAPAGALLVTFMRLTANQAASGNSAIALWFHAGRFSRAMPEQIRYAVLHDSFHHTLTKGTTCSGFASE
jgi:hypothetical protein